MDLTADGPAGDHVRLSVVMVSDIVGSTTLRAALGERRATEMFSTLEATTTEVVAGFGGRIVKHLGDGTLAVFSSATEALRAAAAVQVSATELSELGDTELGGTEPAGTEPAGTGLGGTGLGETEQALAIRVGLSVGDVDAVGDDVAGMPVVVAARLCDRAGDGQILADSSVADLSWHRTGCDLEPLGAMDLKGCPRPIEVVRVPWQRPRSTGVLPPLLRRKLDDVFVGRGAELDMLETAWAEATAGDPLIVSITGEAGMGKTTLLARFAQRVTDSGGEVLAGTCIEGPQAPFPAWSQAIDDHAAEMSYPALVTAAGADARVIARLSPCIAERLQVAAPTEAVDTPQRLYESVAGFLSRRARIAPLLVVLDDLQWAGEDSAQMLRGVAAALEGPVLLVVAHRETDVGSEHALVAALADVTRDRRVREHHLAGLAHGELGDLVAAVQAGSPDLDDERLSVLERRAGGNPLFIRELVWDTTTAGGDEVSSASAVVRSRVGKLAAETQRVLAVAALMGPVFEVSVLQRCELGLNEDELLCELDAARSAGIIQDRPGHPDQFVFMHGLVPEVLVEDLSALRRSRLHLRLAEAFGDGAAPAVRAHHYVRSRLAEALEPAVESSRAAAREQAAALAYEQASQTLLDVLDLIEELAPGRDDLSGWLYSDLAGFRYQLGEIEGRRDAAARAGATARRSGDVELLQQAAIQRAGFPQPGHPDALAVELLEEAIERTPDRDAGIKAELLSVLAYYRGINESRRDEADVLALDAISLARTRGSARDLAEALAARSFLLTAAPGVEEQLALCDELASLVDRLESAADRERHRQYLHRQRGPLLLRSGDIDGFVDELEQLERLGTERRSWIALATSLMWRAMLAHAGGDLTSAESLYDEMAEVGRDQANFAQSYAFALFVLRRDQGRLAELLDSARSVVAASGQLRAFEPVLAVIESDCGNRDEAERIWRAWTKDSFARLPRDVTESGMLPLLADLCIEFGTPQDATRLAAIMEPYQGELMVAAWGICCMGAADRYRSMLQAHIGDHEAADSAAKAAQRLEASVGFRGMNRGFTWLET